ncbi:hypothetical protein F7725_009462 [Dissostichus mawsoni]|uniref:Uncharacterized protein n=1 Tax=Dissostichus mawsoni TaxID=36200 RepID=A0A7J5XKU4_DISMA|nr:hypothetical protein F7725_009462 [Dissostichus mawsoni]
MLRKIQKEVFGTTTPRPRVQTEGANTKIVPFITTYSSHSTVMGRQMKQHFQEIMGDQFVNQPTKVISAFRRNPNLKDLLVRAKLPPLGTNKLKISTHLVKHFTHHGPENLCLRGIVHNPVWTTTERQKEERNWIRKLGTIYPGGLNKAYR